MEFWEDDTGKFVSQFHLSDKSGYCLSVKVDLGMLRLLLCARFPGNHWAVSFMVYQFGVYKISVQLNLHPALFLVCNHVTRRPCWWSKQKKFFC